MSDLLERAETLLARALEQPEADQVAYVTREAGTDHAVRAEVLSLLGDDTWFEPPVTAKIESSLDPRVGWRLQAEGLIGSTLSSRYRIESLVAVGGGGAVVRGTDLLSEEPVAIKLLARTRAREGRQELSALRLLRAPGLVPLLDDGLHEGLTFVVMPWIDGEPFGARAEPQPWDDVEPVLAALLETLGRVHAEGMLHNDLKPANVLVAKGGLPTLLDLGIASWRGAGTDNASAAGTWRYLSPERARGLDATTASDLFATGVMAWEALTGRRWYADLDGPELVARIRAYDSAAHGAACRALPDAALAALEPLLHPAPLQRPTDAHAARAPLRSGNPTVERVLAALTETCAPPWSATDLMSLFDGPERFFRLRSDAAELLTARSGGEAPAVAETLIAWLRHGVLRWEGDRLLANRGGLQALRHGLRVNMPAAPAGRMPPAPSDLELLRLIALASGALRRSNLRSDQERAAAKRLADGGWVTEEEDERLRALGLPPGNLAPEERRLTHAAIAKRLPVAEPTRVQHLLAGGARLTEVRDAAVATGHALVDQQRISEAFRVVEEGLRAAAQLPVSMDNLDIVVVTLVAAGLSSHRPWVERAVGYLERLVPEGRVGTIVRAVGMATLHAFDGASQAAIEELPPFDEIDHATLMRLAQATYAYACRSLDAEERQQVDAERLADLPSDHPLVLDRRAWAAYQEDDYATAARLHERRMPPPPATIRSGGIAAVAASAWIEAGEVERARPLAEQTLAVARSLRSVAPEAHASLSLRRIAYALGQTQGPDLELVAACETLGIDGLRVMALMTEGAIAWRANELEIARDLLTRLRTTTRIGDDAEFIPFTEVALSLVVPCKDLASLRAHAYAFDRERGSPLRLEGLAMAAHAGVVWGQEVRDEARSLAALVPAKSHHLRRTFLSIEESMKWMALNPADR